MPTDGEITHASDTALMVAACRAHETELEDSFVRDPFASRLAGERGKAILDEMPYANVLRMGLAIRTRFVDELLLEGLTKHPIATVLSVGCGLDTRPWRLNLPSNLRWIEIDFADVLDYKERLMSGETPRCRRERLIADVNDPAQRRAMYEAAGAESALIISEGLLMYLPGCDGRRAGCRRVATKWDRALDQRYQHDQFCDCAGRSRRVEVDTTRAGAGRVER